MELFQELLFTVALSLLVSFVLAKLLSMASSDDVTRKDFVSAMEVIERAAVSREPKRGGDCESDERVQFVGEAVELREHEEKGLRVETIGLSVMSNDGGQIADSFVDGSSESEREKFREIEVSSENRVEKSREIRREPENLVGKSREIERKPENPVEESPEGENCREIEIESQNPIEEIRDEAKNREFEVESQNSVEESTKIWEMDIELVKDGVSEHKGCEGDRAKSNEEEEEEGFFDDWEGIERTELEKRFGAAAVFVASKSNAGEIANLGSDVKMELYGLHKVATEGPCWEPQPMALKVSARAYWNAWQQLGNMIPEAAMEQYVTLLSRSIPGWKGEIIGDGQQDLSDSGASSNQPSELQRQPGVENERKSEELKACVGECDVTGVESPNSLNKWLQFLS